MVDLMLRFGVMAVIAMGVLQDPTTSLPDAYKVQFENDHVRVVRVHYDAGAKLPEHTHPGGTTVYVYLNDSEGVVFSHVGGSNRAVTRPAVKAGAIRIAAGPEEHHTAENSKPIHRVAPLLSVAAVPGNAATFGPSNVRRVVGNCS